MVGAKNGNCLHRSTTPHGYRGYVVQDIVGESAHWLGGKNLGVLIFGMPMELSGIPPGSLPRVRLRGITLTSMEAVVTKGFGWTRAMAHYGLSTRWFPYTPWVGRDRIDVVTLEMMDGSLRGPGRLVGPQEVPRCVCFGSFRLKLFFRRPG